MLTLFRRFPLKQFCLSGFPFLFSSHQADFPIWVFGAFQGVDGLDKESSMEASGVALSGTVEQKGLVENGSFFHGLFDGFWGLSAGRKGCSPTCTKSYLDELADQGALTSPSFAMCVNDFGGLFNVGGINEKLVGGKFSYVQYKESDEGDYIINTTKIKVRVRAREERKTGR